MIEYKKSLCYNKVWQSKIKALQKGGKKDGRTSN